MHKLLIIVGPTSTGKTDLALQLASKFQGELVSVDSRQVYKGLDIGTGKLPEQKLTIKKGERWWEINGIRVWMYDVISPAVQYTVADYVKNSRKVVEDIQRRGILPIIVGGTGLYLKAALYGLSNLSVPVDRKLRKELEQLTVSQLQEKLKEISSERWKRMDYSDQQNPRRLIRAIELELGKRVKSNSKSQGIAQAFNILKIGLTAQREILYQRSDARVISRIKQGMIEEAERLNNGGLSFKRMRQLGLEYGILADYLDGKIKNKEELISILQGKIHNYIRRQLTWFKKEKDINWFDIKNSKTSGKIENLMLKWYDSSNICLKK